MDDCSSGTPALDGQILQNGVKREEGRAGLGRSPGQEGSTNNQGKNAAKAWVGLRSQAPQAVLSWDFKAPRGGPSSFTTPRYPVMTREGSLLTS